MPLSPLVDVGNSIMLAESGPSVFLVGGGRLVLLPVSEALSG